MCRYQAKRFLYRSLPRQADNKRLTIETDLIHRAGLTRKAHARCGVITLIQRFGSALNLNVHLHMLVLDGVYTEHHGRARFHPVTAPTAEQMKRLLDRIIQRTVRQLVNQGALIEDAEQPWLNLQDPDTLDQLSAASVRYRIAIGPDTGRRTLKITNPGLAQSAPERSHLPKPFTVNRDGFSLNAAVSIPAHRRDRLEHLCRYLTRPALCLERLSQRPDGRVQWQLKRPFRDGTTHFVFTPEDFIARLAALVPRPQHNLTRYHGVFAPSAALRSRITPAGSGGSAGQRRRHKRCKGRAPTPTPIKAHSPDQTSPDQPIAPLSWATRLKRVFNIDITQCPHCGERLRVIAEITLPDLIQTILEHRKERNPAADTARAPPAKAPGRATPAENPNSLSA